LDQLRIVIKQNIAHPPDTRATGQLVPNEPEDFGEFFEGRTYGVGAREVSRAAEMRWTQTMVTKAHWMTSCQMS
jgi:hypothetical protein